jgi:hypothetical protein
MQTNHRHWRVGAMFVLLVFHKSDLIKSCSSFEDLSTYKIAWSHVNWCKFCIHLISLNDRHIEFVEATELKIIPSRSSSMA